MLGDLWRVWRLYWKLGGPVAVWRYLLDGTLDERIDAALREDRCARH